MVISLKEDMILFLFIKCCVHTLTYYKTVIAFLKTVFYFMERNLFLIKPTVGNIHFLNLTIPRWKDYVGIFYVDIRRN